jgi:hypothetical protein
LRLRTRLGLLVIAGLRDLMSNMSPEKGLGGNVVKIT